MAKYTKTAWHAGRLITRNDMEKIEDQFEMITPGATNVAENYKSSETYSKGDYCLYDGELWKCIATPVGTDEEKKPKDNSTYWTKTKIMNETNSGISQSIANEYKENQNYEIGDYVTYHTDLYRCIEATHGAWNSQKWELVILSNDITDLISVQNQQPDNDVNKIWIKKTGDSEVTLLTKADIEENYSNIIAPMFSESDTYAKDDYVYYDGALYRFTTDHAAGTWTGNDAVEVRLAGEVGELRSTLNELKPYNYSVTDNLYSPKFITNGYRLNIDTGDLDETATHSVTDYIPVTAGETLYASIFLEPRRLEILSSYDPRICFYDAEKAFIENSGVQDSHATVPLNAKYMRFSAYYLSNIQDVMIGTTITPYIAFKTIADDYKIKIASLETAISSAQNDITNIAYVDKTDSIGAELTWTSGYVTKGGNIHTSDSYHYSELISVTPGDIISTVNNFRFVTAYVNESAVESLGTENVTSYTVPDTVTGVIVTLGVSNTSVNHTYKVIFDGLAQHVKAIEDKIDGVTFNNGKTVFRATADSLTSGEILEACSNIDNKKNDTIIFYANLNAVTFGSVTVGHGYNMAYGASVTVDATKITTAYGTNANYYNVNHGLTIDKFLMIKVKHTDNARADIQIETASGQFNITANYVAWGGSKGSVFALSTNSTLTNVELSSTFADFEQNIFLFGDSYVSLGDSARYSTVLINNGYTNLMIDGYGGRNSANAILSFRQVIAAAKPKFVIWALGMNDPDSSTAINASYKSCLDEIIALCETCGVTPILTTIPNTPTRTSTFKNAYIKSLGHRFIDFAKAVGAEESGSTWWNGMLEESDNPENRVHPTALGAQALYARFLIDVPEIANLK